jgi:hypothetical protein
MNVFGGNFGHKEDNMKFRCDCMLHILEIKYTKPTKKDTFGDLWFGIYDIYSPKGRKYKKPKLRADAIIINNYYPKELTKLLNWFPLNLDKIGK